MIFIMYTHNIQLNLKIEPGLYLDIKLRKICVVE